MNTKELKVEMIRHDDNVKKLAEFLGIAPVTMSRKLCGESEFTQTEMNKIRSRYSLDEKRFVEIFSEEVKV